MAMTATLPAASVPGSAPVPDAATAPHAPAPGRDRTMALVLGAIGVVYGDIGTSPLYTIRECFGHGTGLAPTIDHVMGILSLIFWLVFLVVTVKYVLFMMCADNRGEGGILALMALTIHGWGTDRRRRWWLMVLGLTGAALFYGDGMITPAISVLSAVEGLQIATPMFAHYVVPLTIAIIIGLFVVQQRGTALVGALFGPVMCVWFACLALLGVVQILRHPGVLAAANPLYALRFMGHDPWLAFVALGAVVLALTGAEALYADMGHFGRRPIRRAWFFLVLPALMLNYFGQGALIIAEPAAAHNPFYLLVPSWALLPMVGLATLATVIASQAVISGAFSVTRQAVQLGYCPRLEIRHTSEREIGQIYIPQINWGLLGAIIVLVLGFRSSSSLAAAYGIAVTGTMVITTLLAFVVVRGLWGWSRLVAIAVIGVFLVIDLALFSANLLKIVEGGWFPLAMGLAVFTLMATWRKGRRILLAKLRGDSVSLQSFFDRISEQNPPRVKGTAVFMTGLRQDVPYALLHNLKHNKVLHERVVLLTVLTEEIPYVAPAERIAIRPLERGFLRIVVRYGFMEDPDVPQVLGQCDALGYEFNMLETSFFLGRERLVPTVRPELARWREWMFIHMSRNATSATDFFHIPPNRVVELGTQVEL